MVFKYFHHKVEKPLIYLLQGRAWRGLAWLGEARSGTAGHGRVFK